MLALLAFVVAPALAAAEGVEKVYETNIPNSGGSKSSKPGSEAKALGEHEQQAESSEVPAGKRGTDEGPASEGTSPSEGEEKTGNENEGKNAGATKPNDNGPGSGNGQSNQGNGSKTGQASIGEQEAVAGGTPASTKVASDSGGGSSPVLWIVLAVAVLAAISIGTVILRQRRQDDGGPGSPVSPKAG